MKLVYRKVFKCGFGKAGVAGSLPILQSLPLLSVCLKSEHLHECQTNLGDTCNFWIETEGLNSFPHAVLPSLIPTRTLMQLLKYTLILMSCARKACPHLEHLQWEPVPSREKLGVLALSPLDVPLATKILYMNSGELTPCWNFGSSLLWDGQRTSCPLSAWKNVYIMFELEVLL